MTRQTDGDGPRADWRGFVRRRLIEPLLHHGHPPEYTARGVGIGLCIAMTPTVGIQIPILIALWGLIRGLRRQWEFSLIAATAWTFVTNVFTVAPVYYVFVQTGRIMLGRFDRLRGYDTYRGRFEDSFDENLGFFHSIGQQFVGLIETFGLPLFVGSIPWAVLAGVGGYYWSRRFIRHRRARKSQPGLGEVAEN